MTNRSRRTQLVLTRARRASRRLAHVSAAVIVVLVAVAGCRSRPLDRQPTMLRLEAPDVTATARPEPRCDDYRIDKRALFGDLHVHTSYSLDANLRGTRLNPDDAYRFARGARVPVPPFGPQDARTLYLQLDRPLDFAAVTDHAEFLGVISLCEDDRSPVYNRAGCKLYRADPDTAFLTMNSRLTNGPGWRRRPQICGVGEEDHCIEARMSMWHDIQAIAERHYARDSACSFTSFVGYEWTASPSQSGSPANNLHRNVIFRNEVVPQLPADFFDYPTVDAFHEALRDECREADNDCDVLAIPHNANLSGGLMFPTRDSLGEPFSASYAEARQAMEPLIEIYQHKGASECVPGSLSGDEFCGFELLPYDSLGNTVLDRKLEPAPINFVRHAFALGLQMEATLGVNPYRYGIVASTDNHLALAGSVKEAAFAGGGGASSFFHGRALPDESYFSGGGLVGVWAEQNARSAIFDALTRREVFGTSGPRITVRTYLGWDLPRDACAQGTLPWSSLREGTPMGGELTKELLQEHETPPELFVVASRDPGSSHEPGANLERIQLVKGWLDADGEHHVDVVDVAVSENAYEPPESLSCERPQGGSPTLCAQFTDPSWEPDENAYYYFRVLEVPTCRWSTAQCVAADFDCEGGTRPIDFACCQRALGLNQPDCTRTDCALAPETDAECCNAKVVEPRIRERAWTSPVWIRPEATAPLSARSAR